jgi:hypothetical protein
MTSRMINTWLRPCSSSLVSLSQTKTHVIIGHMCMCWVKATSNTWGDTPKRAKFILTFNLGCSFVWICSMWPLQGVGAHRWQFSSSQVELVVWSPTSTSNRPKWVKWLKTLSMQGLSVQLCCVYLLLRVWCFGLFLLGAFLFRRSSKNIINHLFSAWYRLLQEASSSGWKSFPYDEGIRDEDMIWRW